MFISTEKVQALASMGKLTHSYPIRITGLPKISI